ncbi:MAG: surface carbohydrate biosynthesis protein [Wenzhouxiangella sp.]
MAIPGPLILPCETRVREFDAKLLLGLLATSHGYPAVVGSKKSIDLSLGRYQPGVYIGKSLTARSRHNLDIARACGHRVVLWDEEGLVWASREVYWKTKVDSATLNAPELLIAWGEDNARAWTEHPDYAGPPVLALGNPRADLLKAQLRKLFAAEVADIQATHGRFILLNTNFSRVNHLQPRQNRHLKWLREQRPDDPRGGFAAHKFELFKAFVELIPALARRLPEVPIVIRPHPSERAETWESLVSGFPQVSVAQHGNVVAWLLASQGLIHNGCTTAVEAYQLGRPALAYRPLRSQHYDHPLPNGISLSAESLEPVVAWIQRTMVDADPVFAEQADAGGASLMMRALAGLNSEQLAAERILDALAPLFGSSAKRPRAWTARLLGLRRLLRMIEERIPGTANYRPYLSHMFPDIDQVEVEQRCRQMGACLGLAGLPAVRQLESNVFRLDPTQDSRLGKAA